jgi:solute carrier family 35 protein F1/2
MVGLFATIICFAQASILERQDVYNFFVADGVNDERTCERSVGLWVLGVYFVSSYFCYVGTAYFLRVSEATFFNLSLLTGDLWSVAFLVAAQHILPKPLFFIALILKVVGFLVYETALSPVLEDRKDDRAVDPAEGYVMTHMDGTMMELPPLVEVPSIPRDASISKDTAIV